MFGSAHNFSKSPGTVKVSGTPTWKLTCRECGWSQIIASKSTHQIQQCPLCGWEEIEPLKEGYFIPFSCSKHGEIICVVTNSNSGADDIEDAFCPYCKAAS